MNRRTLIGAATAAVAAPWNVAHALAGRPRPQAPHSFLDAMGEIRTTHIREVLRAVIDSGTRSVTVTLTDPKIFGEAALDAALKDLSAYDRHIETTADLLLKATSVADIARAERDNKIALFYLLQNTTPIHKDFDRIDLLYNLGLRSLQLTYNYQNYVGAGCREPGDHGLTLFGHEVVERMNEIGMLIDTSHANMATMADAIRTSWQPTIISHTACQAVHQHVRNTTDENLRLFAEHGGLVGMCQIRPFLTDDRSDDNVRFLLRPHRPRAQRRRHRPRLHRQRSRPPRHYRRPGRGGALARGGGCPVQPGRLAAVHAGDERSSTYGSRLRRATRPWLRLRHARDGDARQPQTALHRSHRLAVAATEPSTRDRFERGAQQIPEPRDYPSIDIIL